MVEWWASFCVEEAVGHWARFFGGALRKVYNIPEEKIVYFRVHAQADLEEHDGVMAHADLDWMVLKKMLEEGKAETRPGFNLEYCLRMGTAYFAWFFEGVYQYVKKEGFVQRLIMAGSTTSQELSPRPLMRILGDFANSQILDAALEYDFFTLIDNGFRQRRGSSARKPARIARATRIVLDSLPALGLGRKARRQIFSDADGGGFPGAREAFLRRRLSPRRAGAVGRHGASQRVAQNRQAAQPHGHRRGAAGLGKARARHHRHRRAGGQGAMRYAQDRQRAQRHQRARYRRRLEHLRHDDLGARSDGAGHPARLAQRQRGGEENSIASAASTARSASSTASITARRSKPITTIWFSPAISAASNRPRAIRNYSPRLMRR